MDFRSAGSRSDLPFMTMATQRREAGPIQRRSGGRNAAKLVFDGRADLYASTYQ